MSDSGNEKEANGPSVFGATTDIKMAEREGAHGLKRRLSVSPPVLLETTKSHMMVLGAPKNNQTAKKRVLSFISDEICEIEQETGNDPANPAKGHDPPGNDTNIGQVRAEYKMAAPMTVNKPDHTNLSQVTVNMLPPLAEAPKPSRALKMIINLHDEHIAQSMHDSNIVYTEKEDTDNIAPRRVSEAAREDRAVVCNDTASLLTKSIPNESKTPSSPKSDIQVAPDLSITKNVSTPGLSLFPSPFSPPVTHAKVNPDLSTTDGTPDDNIRAYPSCLIPGDAIDPDTDASTRDIPPISVISSCRVTGDVAGDIPVTSGISINPSYHDARPIPAASITTTKKDVSIPTVPPNPSCQAVKIITPAPEEHNSTNPKAQVSPSVSTTDPVVTFSPLQPTIGPNMADKVSPINPKKTNSPKSAGVRSTRLRSRVVSKPNKPHKPASTSCSKCPACADCDVSTKENIKPNPNPKLNPKPSRGRGRPRKSSTITTPTSTSKNTDQLPQDFRSLLLDIKCEVSTVNEKQETCKNDLCTLMDTKMNDFKNSVGDELTTLKTDVKNSAALLTVLQESQSALSTKIEVFEGLKNDVTKNSNTLTKLELSNSTLNDDIDVCKNKMVFLEDKTCDLEIDLVKQKRGVDQVSQTLSQQINDVEYGLAAHIETVKGNVEKELGGAKQSQILLENKLANFTAEIQYQNNELNNKIRDLRGDFEQLKTLSDTPTEPSDYSSFTPSTRTGFSVNSSQSDSTHPDNSEAQYFSNLDDSTDENDPFYMYGDTNKSLIVNGLRETRHENLGEVLLHCINDIEIQIGPNDIEKVHRIGKFDRKSKRPRPVKIVLRDQTKRDQILIFKRRFRNSDKFSDIRVNKEQRKDLRVKAAKLRQAALAGKNMGHEVEIFEEEIKIDGIRYSTFALDRIPLEFMVEANQIKNAPINVRRLSLYDKSTIKAYNVIMVGPALQKTPYGLAFFSSQCFLSNFFNCSIFFRGRHYTSLEQGYQCTKADLHNDVTAFRSIYRAKSPAEMKQKGGEIQIDEKWHTVKLQVMEDLLFAKFRQNKTLYYSLLNTRPMNLIEATIDSFWGANCILKSIALEEGCWQGLNHLGKLLIKVRNVFVRELQMGQGSIQ